MIVDVTCRPEKLLEFKTQLGENQPVSNLIFVGLSDVVNIIIYY